MNFTRMCFLKLVIALILTTFSIDDIKASHIFGSQIAWEHIKGNTYLFKVLVYRDCYGVTISGNIGLKFTGDSISHYYLLDTVSSREVTPKCKNDCSSCTSGSCTSSIGIIEYIYADTIKLDTFSLYKNCPLKLNVSVNSRSSGTSTFKGNSMFYTEAMIDICSKSPNNSPALLTDFILGSARNSGVILDFSNRSVDTVNSVADSQFFRMVPILEDENKSVQYNSGFSYRFPINYRKTSNGLYFDSLSGVMAFTTTSYLNTIIGVRVEEYQNGKMINYITREMPFVVEDVNSVIHGIKGELNGRSLSSVNGINICMNDSINFSIYNDYTINGSGNNLYYFKTNLPLKVTKEQKGKFEIFKIKGLLDSTQVKDKKYFIAFGISEADCPQKRGAFFFNVNFNQNRKNKVALDLQPVDSSCGSYLIKPYLTDSSNAKSFTYSLNLDSSFKKIQGIDGYYLATENGNKLIKSFVNLDGCKFEVSKILNVKNASTLPVLKEERKVIGLCGDSEFSVSMIQGKPDYKNFSYFWSNGTSSDTTAIINSEIPVNNSYSNFNYTITDKNSFCSYSNTINTYKKTENKIPPFNDVIVACYGKGEKYKLPLINGKGSWYGEYVENNFFDVSKADSNGYKYAYFGLDTNGVCYTTSQIFTIKTPLDVALTTDTVKTCIDRNEFKLTSYLQNLNFSTYNMKWFGTGVVKRNNFDNSIKVKGSYPVWNTRDHRGCRDSSILWVIIGDNIYDTNSVLVDTNLCVLKDGKYIIQSDFLQGDWSSTPSNYFTIDKANKTLSIPINKEVKLKLHLNYYDENRCVFEKNIAVNVVESTPVKAGADQFICYPSRNSVLLNGLPSQNGRWQGNGIDTQTASLWLTIDSTMFGENEMVYSRVSELGCVDYDTVSINVFANPKAHVQDELICVDDDYELTINASPKGGFIDGKYKISDSTILVNKGDVGEYYYRYTYTDANNCKGLDSFSVKVGEKISVGNASYSPLIGFKPLKVTFKSDYNSSNKHTWYFANGDSANVLNTSYTYADTGWYRPTLIVFDSMGYCSDTFKGKRILIKESLSIGDIDEGGPKIYPTLFENVFMLSCANCEQQVIRILNNKGQLITSFNMASQQQKQVDLSGYSSGVYYVQAIGDEFVRTYKMVKK